jgi:hypothetical protein
MNLDSYMELEGREETVARNRRSGIRHNYMDFVGS